MKNSKAKAILRTIVRTVVVWGCALVGLLLMAWILPGVSVDTLGTAIVAVAAIALLNGLYVSSFYDPETEEGAAFEEQIGFHGGMGGSQTQPFVLFPSDLPLADEPLLGAEAVHRLLKGWVSA